MTAIAVRFVAPEPTPAAPPPAPVRMPWPTVPCHGCGHHIHIATIGSCQSVDLEPVMVPALPHDNLWAIKSQAGFLHAWPVSPADAAYASHRAGLPGPMTWRPHHCPAQPTAARKDRRNHR